MSSMNNPREIQNKPKYRKLQNYEMVLILDLYIRKYKYLSFHQCLDIRFETIALKSIINSLDLNKDLVDISEEVIRYCLADFSKLDKKKYSSYASLPVTDVDTIKIWNQFAVYPPTLHEQCRKTIGEHLGAVSDIIIEYLHELDLDVFGFWDDYVKEKQGFRVYISKLAEKNENMNPYTRKLFQNLVDSKKLTEEDINNLQSHDYCYHNLRIHVAVLVKKEPEKTMKDLIPNPYVRQNYRLTPIKIYNNEYYFVNRCGDREIFDKWYFSFFDDSYRLLTDEERKKRNLQPQPSLQPLSLVFEFNGKKIPLEEIEKKASVFGGEVLVVPSQNMLYDANGNSIALF